MATNAEHLFHGMEIGGQAHVAALAPCAWSILPAQVIDSHRHDWPLLTFPVARRI